MVWGTDLGSGYSQDAHSLKDNRAIDREKNKSFVTIQIGFSQNIASLSSVHYCLDFFLNYNLNGKSDFTRSMFGKAL